MVIYDLISTEKSSTAPVGIKARHIIRIIKSMRTCLIKSVLPFGIMIFSVAAIAAL